MHEVRGRLRAFACIAGGEEAPCISGVVKFYESKLGVLVSADIFCLPEGNGIHGFHIHEGEACTGEGFADTRNHYNPAQRAHPFHAGDLPPLFSCNGRAHMQVLIGRFQIREVIGRTVVIHEGPDDFHSQPGGNAGQKIACGVIRACCRS